MSVRIGRTPPAAVAAVLLSLAAPAPAQVPEGETAELPRETAAEAIDFYNRLGTVRLAGESLLAEGSEIRGDVAVLGGSLTIAGAVHGDVVVINGDLRLRPGARIEGAALVIGGSVTGYEARRVSGGVRAYRQPLRYRRENGRIAYAPRPPERALVAGRDFDFGRFDLTMRVHRAYNRVEGLPVAVGPRLRAGTSNPTHLQAFVLYRTGSGLRLRTDEMGYLIDLEQYVGGRRTARLGLRSRSEVAPIEAWGLSDRENSLSTFVLHRDYRDYYERTGWAGYFRIAPTDRSYDLLVELREDRHESVPARAPWALSGNNRDWRPQALVAEGRLRSLVGSVVYDTRNDDLDPSSGWLIRAQIESGLGGSLAYPAIPEGENGEPALEPTVSGSFTSGIVDVRRYARIDPNSRIGFRFLAAGSLDGEPLPPQRQHALGGEGSLPAYGLLQFDCGARQRRVTHRGETFFVGYGCDRLSLFQFEYHSVFRWGRDLIRRLGWDLNLGETPGWVAFFGAGRAWTEVDNGDGRDDGLGDLVADAGLGVRLGHVGVYWGVPLSGRGRKVNFFVRIGPRF